MPAPKGCTRLRRELWKDDMKSLRVFKEVLYSSLPLVAVIILVCVFIAPMENAYNYVKLAVGYACVVVGQTLFLVGLEESILPIGKLVGKSLIKLKKRFLSSSSAFSLACWPRSRSPRWRCWRGRRT